MSYIRRFGMPRAEARARDAGTHVGATKPVRIAGMAPTFMPSPPAVYILQKTLISQVPATPSSLTTVQSVQPHLGLTMTPKLYREYDIPNITPALGLRTAASVTLELDILKSATQAFGYNTSVVLTRERHMTPAPALGVNMNAAVFTQFVGFSVIAANAIGLSMAATLTRIRPAAAHPVLGASMTAALNFEQHMTVSPSIGIAQAVAITLQSLFAASPSLGLSQATSLSFERHMTVPVAPGVSMGVALSVINLAETNSHYLLLGASNSPFAGIMKYNGTSWSNLPLPAPSGTGFVSGGAGFNYTSHMCFIKDQSSGKLTTYSFDGTTIALVDTTSAFPNLAGSGGGWGDFASAGSILGWVDNTHSPFFYAVVYDAVAHTFTDVTSSVPNNFTVGGSLGEATFSRVANMFAVPYESSPYVKIWHVTDPTTWTTLTAPFDTTPTGGGRDCCFNDSDASVFAVVHSNSPFLSVYSRSGNSFTKMPNPATLPPAVPNGVAINPAGTLMVTDRGVSNTLDIWTISGTTVTHVGTATLSGNAAGFNAMAFNRDGTMLGVGLRANPTVDVFSVSGTTLTKITTIVPPNIGWCGRIDWSHSVL